MGRSCWMNKNEYTKSIESCWMKKNDVSRIYPLLIFKLTYLYKLNIFQTAVQWRKSTLCAVEEMEETPRHRLPDLFCGSSPAEGVRFKKEADSRVTPVTSREKNVTVPDVLTVRGWFPENSRNWATFFWKCPIVICIGYLFFWLRTSLQRHAGHCSVGGVETSEPCT